MENARQAKASLRTSFIMVSFPVSPQSFRGRPNVGTRNPYPQYFFINTGVMDSGSPPLRVEDARPRAVAASGMTLRASLHIFQEPVADEIDAELPVVDLAMFSTAFGFG